MRAFRALTTEQQSCNRAATELQQSFMSSYRSSKHRSQGLFLRNGHQIFNLVVQLSRGKILKRVCVFVCARVCVQRKDCRSIPTVAPKTIAASSECASACVVPVVWCPKTHSDMSYDTLGDTPTATHPHTGVFNKQMK